MYLLVGVHRHWPSPAAAAYKITCPATNFFALGVAPDRVAAKDFSCDVSFYFVRAHDALLGETAEACCQRLDCSFM